MPSTPPQGDPAPVDGSLPADRLIGSEQRRLSAYVHVPYCSSRCGYCDFNTYTAAELGAEPGSGQDAYLAAVRAEFTLAERVLGSRQPLQTVFFGGGTPTLLPAGGLAGLLDGLRQTFGLAPDCEVTTEANPESVDQAYLEALRAAGFNRLSLGMQSAVPSVLQVLERRHTPGRVAQVVGWARSAGFESISLDLIYANPHETLDQWRTSVEAALALGPDHLSAYSLIVEPGTRLAARIGRGELPLPDSDQQADCYLIADELFASAGFDNYEVSNWARAGHQARHNLAYWHSDDWWGFGPGAHSHVNGVRWWNLRHPAAYTATLAAGSSPAQAREVLEADERRVEQVMLELRLAEGLPREVLTEPETARLPGLAADGLIEVTERFVRFTRSGRLLADGVIRNLLD
jgi:putative oxygen-independent coproporphyrinogen III oxidase